MNNAVTMLQFLDLVRNHADVEGLVERHQPDVLLSWGNMAIRRMRMKAHQVGFRYWMEPAEVEVMPSAPPYTGARYFEVDLPAGAVAVGGFDIQLQTNYIPLAPGSFERRGDLRRGYNISNSSLAGKNYIVWFMRSWVDVPSEDIESHQIYAHDTWIEWALQDVVRRVSQKDDDSDNTMAEALRRQKEIEDDMRAAALKMRMGGARRPRRVTEAQEVGFWEVTRLPIEDGSGGLSAGKIAIMPNQGRRI